MKSALGVLAKDRGFLEDVEFLGLWIYTVRFLCHSERRTLGIKIDELTESVASSEVFSPLSH